MDKTKVKAKALAIGLGVLQIFIGVGGVAGGMVLVLDPSGRSMGLPLEFLNSSPFPNFLIPGLTLLLINGLGSLVGGLASVRRYQYAGEIAAGLGAFLVLWIVIQVLIIGLNTWIQPAYFVLGLLELALGLLLKRALSG